MSKINLEDFANRFAAELNIENKELLAEDLTNLPEYDSMGKINISLLIEELFGFQIDYEELNQLNTLESLYRYCCNR